MGPFEDTEIAFAGRSNRDLTRAYWIFLLVNSAFLVKLGAFLLRFAMALRIPVKWALKPTVFAHFCGGESIRDSQSTIGHLAQSNVFSILDYSAEGKERESDFDNTREQVIQTINEAAHHPWIPFAVFKPSGLVSFALLEKLSSGQAFSKHQSDEFGRFVARMNEICFHASKTGVPVMVDAEESWIQSGVDGLVEHWMFEYNKDVPLIYNTLQLYRHDRLDQMQLLLARAREKGVKAAFKLVRGAYMEKERARAGKVGYPSPIYPDKPSTDAAFDKAVRICLEQIDHVAICIGTHNEQSCIKAIKSMKELGISHSHPHVSFAQLYGMSDHITYNLALQGFRACKYVPYGAVNTVVPYLIRRAEENSSVAGQSSRELTLIRTEIRRRREKI